MKNIELLYEDQFCLIFNKPAGLAVQGGKNIKQSLDSILSSEFTQRPLLVHRLDKDTSGIILTAKNPSAALYFSKIISQKESEKYYCALCYAKDISAIKKTGELNSILEIKGEKKQASTHFKTINSKNNYVLFELRLATGRMHQIRRQLAQINCPVLGDDIYGDFALNKKLHKETGLKKMLLHSSHLIIKNPQGKIIDIASPLPDYFEKSVNDFITQ
ncbi:MAG: RluA family pseudouridine synthase [Spirochaetaceae bacterium]|jgi:23S rRNA pseudouridine955/2504/2580 synthase|nr:RluA family pseudouridine synthase [Spirochaetaceae bacterium]